MTNYDSVRVNGAILQAMIKWQCTLSSGCTRGIEVTRMDQKHQGFKTEKVNYYIQNGQQSRTKITAYGIRILGKAQGIASELSVMNIVLQISSAIGLLLMARSLTDFIMLSIFREKNHYRNMKFLKTE